MKKRSILTVLDDESLFDHLRAAAPEGCDCVLAADGPSALESVRESKPDIVVIAAEKDAIQTTEESSGQSSLCRSLRKFFRMSPLQFILVAHSATQAERILRMGYDAVLLLPASEAELKIALRSAFQRLSVQETLFRDREFYSVAVRREESLSSRLLDEYLALKETLSAITEAKSSLEQANKRLEKAATRDSLSGLLNRASLYERIRLDMRRSEVEGKPFSGILIDIDFFKTINDSWGHLAGDAVIRELGQRMLEHLRQGDHAGRYGGEEFFIALPDTDCERARATAERIRDSFSARPFTYGEQTIEVTASFGVAEHQADEDGEGLVERADRAMYRAKQLGRNRVCIDGE